MMRVLEVIVALVMVLILAVIVGLFLPSHAHIQRSIEISHDPRQIHDVFDNFRRFPDYAGGYLRAQDPDIKFSLSGPAWGPGATISWSGNQQVGSGKLVIKSGHIGVTNKSRIVWRLHNRWHGTDKTFTLRVTPDQIRRVSDVTWSYDVDYGWNLIGRYSQLWIHGQPAAWIQHGLASLQTMLAAIPNVDYGKVNPGLYRTKATPVLLVASKAPRTLSGIVAAKAAALGEIRTAMQQLGVEAAGPTTTITTDYGDTTYSFDVAVPIDTTTLTIDGQRHDLATLPPPPAEAGSRAGAVSAAAASSAGQPVPASSVGTMATEESGPAPGSLDAENQLVVNATVRARMLPARQVLAANWTGVAGLPLMREILRAYADAHGYQFNVTTGRMYQQLISPPGVPEQARIFRVFLPVRDAPAQTPEQAAGKTPPLPPLDASIWNGTSARSRPPGQVQQTRRKH